VVKKLTIANWECGVLLPATNNEVEVNKSAEGQRETRLGASQAEAKAGELADVVREDEIVLLGRKLDLPFSIPARRYGNGEKPWMQMGSW
jgi:hypothetical protein